VPLSEHEQRLLEQMERALYAEDPKLASTLRGADPRRHHRRRVAIGVMGLIAGLVLLLVGVVIPQVAISVVGFLLMFGSLVFAVTSWRQIPSGGGETPKAAATGRGKKGRRPRSRGRMMERIEDRWRRRREQNGQ
jgi:Protein of unknown function (DUF3040)